MRLGVALSLEFSLGLIDLEGYLRTTEEYLQKARNDFEVSANAQAEKLSAANPTLSDDEINDILGNDYWQYADTFPSILRNSFLVSAYSLLEYEMVTICKWLKKERQLPLNVNELKGSTLDQFKTYTKLAGLALNYDDETWNEVQHYSRVRNCIVHHNGLIQKYVNDADFITYINRKNLVSKDLITEQVRLTNQFCKDVVSTISDFLKKVVEAHDSQQDLHIN